MSFNSKNIVENIQAGIEELIELASGDKGGVASADQMEWQLWWGLLEIGRQLMQLFFVARSAAAGKARQVERTGEVYGYKGQRKRGYVSVFGEVEVWRGAYWKRGQGSVFPLDEILSLPERQYSDWVQEIVGELSVCQPYDEAVGLLQKWLPVPQPKRCAEQFVDDHARLVAGYYEQKPVAHPGEGDSLLVVSADGKGIPMNREYSPPPQARRGKGARKRPRRRRR